MRFVFIITILFCCLPLHAQNGDHEPAEKAQEKVRESDGSELKGQEIVDAAGLGELEVLFIPEALLFKPVVGAWSRYSLHNKITRKDREVLVGVCEIERNLGSRAVWVELSTESLNGTPVSMRFLWQIEPLPSRLMRLIVRIGKHSAVETLNSLDPAKEAEKARQEFQKLDSSLLTVAAGTFQATRYRHRAAGGEVLELWVSEKVRPFGLLRSIALSSELELMAHGMGYRPRVPKAAVRVGKDKEDTGALK